MENINNIPSKKDNICLIKFNERSYVTGFFCNILGMNALLTCYEAKEKSKEEINYYTKSEGSEGGKKLTINDQNTLSNKDLDYFCVKLDNKDCVKNPYKVEVVELNIGDRVSSCGYTYIKNKDKYEYCQYDGKIEKIEENYFIYNSKDEANLFGGPIFDSKNHVIGILKRPENKNQEDYLHTGVHINSILKDIEAQKKKKNKQSKNYGISEDEISEKSLETEEERDLIKYGGEKVNNVNEPVNNMNEPVNNMNEPGGNVNEPGGNVNELVKIKNEPAKPLKKEKKKQFIIIIILVLTLVVFCSVFFIVYFLMKANKKEETKLIWEKKHSENNYTNILEYIIDESCQYRICVYGGNAEKGGKGCVQCAESYFEKGSIIQYRLGGKTSGGEGGKECGTTKGDAHNGAGLSWANYSNYFLIVAGGGGGNSESGNKGGDCERNGEGKYGGNGATKNEFGKGGYKNTPSGDGAQFKGGNGARNWVSGQYCGGGGGDGYYGGGGGDWGAEGKDGGGGGGSNYCQNNNGILCEESLLNQYNYSSLKIYKKIYED